jgi:hypothetical protein
MELTKGDVRIEWAALGEGKYGNIVLVRCI